MERAGAVLPHQFLHLRVHRVGPDGVALLCGMQTIGHDVGHPGVNNDFLIKSQTPLAQLYNDKSVLESFHAMTLFNLMQKYGFKIYNNEPPCSSKYTGN